ncbi:conserved protein of unknown function [Legionella longbeachae NSW150]|uniref:Uncharacterized protein n=1 Tax=Legionella longbeachae serogroup 1 (strain NSW150) TaxID=661367 RepID=D3HMM2_LEGLN|nr:conserved protein of unknown function [Legionella longbeachae NSW150]
MITILNLKNIININRWLCLSIYLNKTKISGNTHIKIVINQKVGGGGGNRTRVRKSSAFSSTCVALSFDLTVHSPTGRILHSDSLSFAP